MSIEILDCHSNENGGNTLRYGAWGLSRFLAEWIRNALLVPLTAVFIFQLG